MSCNVEFAGYVQFYHPSLDTKLVKKEKKKKVTAKMKRYNLGAMHMQR